MRMDQNLYNVIRSVLPVSLAHILMHADPAKFVNWQGNHCQQSAVCVAYIMQKFFPTTMQFDVMGFEVADEIYSDIEHYCTVGTVTGQAGWMLIDLKCVRGPVWHFANKLEYPAHIGWSITRMKKAFAWFDWKASLEVNEYFTDRPFRETCEEVLKDVLVALEFVTKEKHDQVRAG